MHANDCTAACVHEDKTTAQSILINRPPHRHRQTLKSNSQADAHTHTHLKPDPCAQAADIVSVTYDIHLVQGVVTKVLYFVRFLDVHQFARTQGKVTSTRPNPTLTNIRVNFWHGYLYKYPTSTRQNAPLTIIRVNFWHGYL